MLSSDPTALQQIDKPLLEIQRSNLRALNWAAESKEQANPRKSRVRCSAYSNLEKKSLNLSFKQSIDVLTLDSNLNKNVKILHEKCVSNFMLRKQPDLNALNKLRALFDESPLLSQVKLSFGSSTQGHKFLEVLRI